MSQLACFALEHILSHNMKEPATAHKTYLVHWCLMFKQLPVPSHILDKHGQQYTKSTSLLTLARATLSEIVLFVGEYPVIDSDCSNINPCNLTLYWYLVFVVYMNLSKDRYLI